MQEAVGHIAAAGIDGQLPVGRGQVLEGQQLPRSLGRAEAEVNKRGDGRPGEVHVQLQDIDVFRGRS